MIQSARLELPPLTADILRASLDGDREQTGRLLRAVAPDVWPPWPETFRMRLAQLESDPTLEPWLLRGIILRPSRELIGHVGFHTGPNPDYLQQLAPGGIELGYTILKPWRHQGFATEAAGAMMRWAREAHGITRFVVSIRPDNAPSLAIASRFGFTRVGEHLDDVDGLEHIFRLDWPATT